MEEPVCCVLLEWDVADFVHDDQSVAAQPDQFLGQAAVLVGCSELADPVDGGGEQDAVTELGGARAQSGGEVCFAGAWQSEQNDVGRFGEKRADGSTRDGVAFEPWLVIEVEFLK